MDVREFLAYLASLPFSQVTLVCGVAAVVAAAAVPRAHAAQRLWLLAAISVLVLGVLVGPIVTVAWIAYALVFHVVVERLPVGIARAALLVGLLLLMIAAPVWWIAALGEIGPRVRELTAFGTNVALLRFWAYAWDRRHRAGDAITFDHYLATMFFFPTFTNGPIETTRTFPAAWPEPTRADVQAGLGRVAGSIVKLAFLAYMFPPGWVDLGQAPDAPWGQLWIWAAQLYIWFYLAFSAWSDAAVGLGRMLGHRVQENFDRPWLGIDVSDFWKRWHVSLGLWLRDYVYIPLGGNRRRRALNVLATFLVSALWHVWGSLKLLGFGYYPMEAWGGFLLWGLLHAIGVIVIARAATAPGPGARLARQVATFAFAAWAWMPFFLPSSVALTTQLRILLHMLVPIG